MPDERHLSEPQERRVPLRVLHDGSVTHVVLDDPSRHNPQSPQLWEALARAARELPDATRIVVLRGNGPSFSAGLDRAVASPAGMAAFFGGAADADSIAARIAGFQEAFTAWRELPAVVVAAVQGHAIGAGFQLALAADLRIVADDVSFSMGEIRLGLVPDLGGTGRLVDLVGTDRALEICLTGRTIGAVEAQDLGLSTLTVPRDELDETIQDLVAAVLAAEADAVTVMLPLLRGASSRTRAEQLRAEREAQAGLIAARFADARGPRHP
ncbi:MAG: enoyl-CoA hydratase/isomerase family protein [Micrococcales bacterium]|nr:enoyl-CoA hydratase/isomerase family protein [Micrococcales bacterium]